MGKKRMTATNFVTSLTRGSRTASSKVIKTLPLDKKRAYSIKYLVEGLSLPKDRVTKFVNEKMKPKDFICLLAVETSEKDFIQLFRNVCIYIDIKFNDLVDDDNIISIFNNESINAFRKIADSYVDSLEQEETESSKEDNTSTADKDKAKDTEKGNGRLIENIVNVKRCYQKYIQDLNDDIRTSVNVFIENLTLSDLYSLSLPNTSGLDAKTTIIRKGIDFVFTQKSAMEINKKLTKAVIEDGLNNKPDCLKTIKEILSKGEIDSKKLPARFKLIEQANYSIKSIIDAINWKEDIDSKLKKLSNIELDSIISNDKNAPSLISKLILPEDITKQLTDLFSSLVDTTLKTNKNLSNSEDEPEEPKTASLLTYLEKVKTNNQFVKNIKAIRTSKNINIIALIEKLDKELPKDILFHKSLDLNEIVNGIYLFSKVNLKYNDDDKALDYLRYRCIEKCITENTKNEVAINKYIKDNDLEIFIDASLNI